MLITLTSLPRSASKNSANDDVLQNFLLAKAQPSMQAIQSQPRTMASLPTYGKIGLFEKLSLSALTNELAQAKTKKKFRSKWTHSFHGTSGQGYCSVLLQARDVQQTLSTCNHVAEEKQIRAVKRVKWSLGSVILLFELRGVAQTYQPLSNQALGLTTFTVL